MKCKHGKTIQESCALCFKMYSLQDEFLEAKTLREFHLLKELSIENKKLLNENIRLKRQINKNHFDSCQFIDLRDS